MFSPCKALLHPKPGTFGDVKPSVSQEQATFLNDVGFVTVICKIYCFKYFDVIQSDVALNLQVH